MAYSREVYPRTWDEGEEPHRPLFGLHDIADFLGVSRSAAMRWRTYRRLPPADGPDVNGMPTWTREMVLVWAYARNAIPVRSIAEAQRILAGPRAQELLELVRLVLR